MKILDDDKITAMSITSGAQFSSIYSVENVLNDNPSLPFMANSKTATIQATISTGVQATFISGLMADSAVMTITDTDNSASYIETLNCSKWSANKWLAKNNSQIIPPQLDPISLTGYSGTVMTSPLTSDTILTEDLTGAPNTLELQANLTLGAEGTEEILLIIGLVDDVVLHNTWSGLGIGAGNISLDLTSSTDLKDSPIEVGTNAIAKWNQSSGATGRFDDSSDAVVNLTNFGNVRVGSIVTISSADYQVQSITGDGTAATAVTLSGSVVNGAITSIVNPIRVGIFRASSVVSSSNPQIGMAKNIQDFSIRRPLLNGGYNQTQRNTITIFNVNLVLTISDANNLMDFYRAIRSKPFPIQVIQDLADSQNEETEYCGFCYFMSSPDMESATGAGDYQNVTFNLREII